MEVNILGAKRLVCSMVLENQIAWNNLLLDQDRKIIHNIPSEIFNFQELKSLEEIYDFIVQEDREQFVKKLNEYHSNLFVEKRIEFENFAQDLQIFNKKGVRTIQFQFSTLELGNNLFLNLHLIDISAIQALKVSQQIAKVGNWTLDFGANVFRASEEALRIFGFPLDSNPTFQEVSACMSPESKQRAHFVLQESIKTTNPYSIEIEIFKHDTHEHRILTSNGVIQYNQAGQPIAVHGTNQDITERKAMESALIESEEKYRMLMENTHDTIYTLDMEANIRFLSSAWTLNTGYEINESVGQNIDQFVHPDDVPDILKIIQEIHITGEKRNGIEYRMRLQNDQWVWHSTNVMPIRDRQGDVIGIEGIATDITQQKRDLNAKIESVNNESLSILTGGIAHDFNNILMGILGNVELLMYASPSPSQMEFIEALKEGTLRAKELTHSFLSFSKTGASKRTIENVVNLVHKSETLVMRGSNSICQISSLDSEHLVCVDSGQFIQVMNNLLINATQAMNPMGGQIEIFIKNIVLTQSVSHIKAGEYVEITIKDEGPGIPEDFQQHIFTPYFTTKLQGNGLGLATSYSIIKQHQGLLRFENNPDKGTTFSILLPLEKTNPNETSLQSEPVLSLRGKILIMDDDHYVQDTLGKMLNYLGLSYDVAKDGNQAIELYQQQLNNGVKYDAVIMDLTVPLGKGGKETIRELLTLDSEVVVIVSSGYSKDPIIENFQDYGFKACLAKPYQLSELYLSLQQYCTKE